jgi:hypothetical protein
MLQKINNIISAQPIVLKKHATIVQRTKMLQNVTMLSDDTFPTYDMKGSEINKNGQCVNWKCIPIGI